MKNTTIITDSSSFNSPYKDVFLPSYKIKIGFWYRQFKIIGSTTIQLGKICFWFTLKPYLKNLLKWIWGLLGTGALLLYFTPIIVSAYVLTVIAGRK